MSNADVIEAITQGNPRRVQQLVEAAPGLAGGKDDNGIPFTLLALYRQQPDVAEALAAAKGQLDVFELAALGRQAGLVERLDADPSLHATRSPDGFTPLHLACFFARSECARTLVDRGADVDATARNPMEVRPVHSATAVGQAEIVELLLRAGATVDSRQRGGITPLHSAAHRGDRKLARLLLDAGADPRAADDEGRDAIAHARESGHDALAEELAGSG